MQIAGSFKQNFEKLSVFFMFGKRRPQPDNLIDFAHAVRLSFSALPARGVGGECLTTLNREGVLP